MTQKIFDTDNAEDMALLWSILPVNTYKVVREDKYRILLYDNSDFCFGSVSDDIININWHDKTEITRPIQEATEDDIGKICVFWNDSEKYYGILSSIKNYPLGTRYGLELGFDTADYPHCRRLTKQEIEELI